MTRTTRGRKPTALLGVATLLVSLMSMMLVSTAQPADAVEDYDFAQVDGYAPPDAKLNDAKGWTGEEPYESLPVCVGGVKIGAQEAPYIVDKDYDLVIVKAGGNGSAPDTANTIFEGVLAGQAVWADTAPDGVLNGELGKDLGISHIILCGEEPPADVVCSDVVDDADFPDLVLEEGDDASEVCFEEPPADVVCSDVVDDADFPDLVLEEGDDASEVCFEEEAEPTTATFDVGTECVAQAPVVNWSVDVTEGDEPFGTRALTVSTPAGTVLESVQVAADANGQIPLKARDGETVVVAFNGEDEKLTLATPCAEVQGVVLEREPPAPAPEPEPEPAPVVLDAAKELPKTGAASDLLLIWGGVLLALGSALLLTERRMTVRRSR